MTSTEIITDAAALEPLQVQWDALALANALPMACPAWMLAWWRFQAPRGAELRTVVVRERDELIGIAPFFAAPRRGGRPTVYRLLADDFSTSVAPLARPGREWEATQAIALALSQVEPRPDILALEPMPLASPWPLALHERWPGPLRAPVWRYSLQDMPIVSLHDGSFDAWLATRSTKFRSSMRRVARLFAAEGGTVRLATADTLQADVDTFARLHARRWEQRGTSRLTPLGDNLQGTLCATGRALLADGPRAAGADPCRFRLRLLELDGEAICTDLSITGGGNVVGFNAGWDERFKRFSPSLLAFMCNIEDGFTFGDRRVELGWGGNPYKLRFANGNDPVAWSLLLPPGRRFALALGHSAPLLAGSWLRRTGKRALSPSQIDRLRALRGRIGPLG
jgi:CelD/BcsL family acetyltransferase involved in cellulose biosynthesis